MLARQFNSSFICYSLKHSVLVAFLLLLSLNGGEVAHAANADNHDTMTIIGRPVEGNLTCLSPEALITLRDNVAYQISMGRSLATTQDQLEKIPAELKLDQETTRKLIAEMYQVLTYAPLVPGESPRALALIGDRYHHPAYIRPPLEKACRAAGISVRFIYDVTLLTAENINQYDILIILRDGMLWPSPQPDDPYGKERVFWLSEQQEGDLAEYVGRGGGFLALHNATALKSLKGTKSQYRDLLGASYAGHGPERETYQVRVVDLSHPVATQYPIYEAIDERHWPDLHVEDLQVFLLAVADGEPSVHGFTRYYGRGRICYLAHGHNQAILEHDAVQEMLVKALRWCLEQSR